jgi:hypothetical protein
MRTRSRLIWTTLLIQILAVYLGKTALEDS